MLNIFLARAQRPPNVTHILFQWCREIRAHKGDKSLERREKNAKNCARMNTIDYTQQQGLYFLSENTQFILNEIIQNVPLLMTISHLQMRQKHMWTDENRGQALVTQLSNLTYKYIRELAMKITEEICNLSSHNFQMVVEYLYCNCDALRMEFKLPKFLPIFFRTVFAQCKQHLQGVRLQPPNESNQQVQMKAAPTASKTSSSTQQNNYHLIRTASQASFVQSAPSMNHISQNSQMCPIIVSNTHSNGPPQTNTYLPLQGARPIWQLNGNNEMLTYQPVQTNQLQVVSAVSMQSQQQQFLQQNSNSNPQLQTQFGVCNQSVTMPCNMQYASNQVAVIGQVDWPVRTFGSYSSVNTNLNQNTMQAHNALPVLRSVDVAQALQNATQQMIGTQAINTLSVLNSNNINCSSAYGFQNENQTKFVDFHKNSGNAIQNQSKLNNNQSVPMYTKLSMTAKSARAPVPQPLIIPSNVDRKRSAASIASSNTVEAAAPPEKVFSISSNIELRSPTSAKEVQPNGDSISLSTREISIANVYENDHEIKYSYDSKSQATIWASARSPAALNESSIDATKIKFGTADLRLSEPRTLKAFTFNAEEEKSSFPKTIYSQEGQYEESDDFEILVQTSTDTKFKAAIEKTELTGEFNELIESSNDNDLDVAVVKTVDEIVLKPKTKVSRVSLSINCNSAITDSENS